jgi:hypothetical protein
VDSPPPSQPTPPPRHFPAPPAPPPRQPHAPLPPGALVFACEFPCIHCSYDLRTIPLASNCPECGKSAADSLHSLAAAVPSGLSRLRLGLVLLLVAGLGIPGFLLLLAIAMIYTSGPGSSGGEEALAYFVGFCVLAVGPCTAAVGSAILANPPLRVFIPNTPEPTPAPPAFPAARLFGIVHCILAVVLALLLASVPTHRGPDEALAVAVATFVCLTCICWDLRNLALTRVLAAYCARANATGTKRLFGIMSVGAIGLAIAHALVGLGALTLYLLSDYVSTLFSGSTRSGGEMAIFAIVSTIASVIQFATLIWLVLWPIMLIAMYRRLGRPLALATAHRGDILATRTDPDAQFFSPATS